jgi:hypothetical protein
VPRESERKIAIPSGNDDKGMRMLRRYYRYKQNVIILLQRRKKKVMGLSINIDHLSWPGKI